MQGGSRGMQSGGRPPSAAGRRRGAGALLAREALRDHANGPPQLQHILWRGCGTGQRAGYVKHSPGSPSSRPAGEQPALENPSPRPSPGGGAHQHLRRHRGRRRARVPAVGLQRGGGQAAAGLRPGGSGQRALCSSVEARQAGWAPRALGRQAAAALEQASAAVRTCTASCFRPRSSSRLPSRQKVLMVVTSSEGSVGRESAGRWHVVAAAAVAVEAHNGLAGTRARCRCLKQQRAASCLRRKLTCAGRRAAVGRLRPEGVGVERRRAGSSSARVGRGRSCRRAGSACIRARQLDTRQIA